MSVIQRTCSDLTQMWQDFWWIFTKEIVCLKGKYFCSNLSKKYFISKKNYEWSEKRHFWTNKWIFTIICYNFKWLWELIEKAKIKYENCGIVDPPPTPQDNLDYSKCRKKWFSKCRLFWYRCTPSDPC